MMVSFVRFVLMLLLRLNQQVYSSLGQLSKSLGFAKKASDFHPRKSAGPGHEWPFWIKVGKSSPHSDRTFLQYVTRVGAIGHCHKYEPQKFWFVFDQQPSELFLGINSFHTMIPQFDAGIGHYYRRNCRFRRPYCRIQIAGGVLPDDGCCYPPC